MARIDEARSDSEWERGDDLVFVSISSEETYTIRTWMRGEIEKVPKDQDEENGRRALVVIQEAFRRHGLILDEERVGKLSLETIRFRLGPYDGVSGISVPIGYFRNAPSNIKRLPASAFNS